MKKEKIVIINLGVLFAFVLFSGALFAWTNETGGDHDNQVWIIASETNISGNHYNISNFTILPNIKVNVVRYNGSNFGYVEINASRINISGTLDASGAGYSGGGGGGGSKGFIGHCREVGFAADTNGNGTPGIGGLSIGGGQNGSRGSERLCLDQCKGGGAGGNGGGSFGGLGGILNSSPGNLCLCTANTLPEWNLYNGTNGTNGKYCNGITSICDTSTDTSLNLGSGGGGGSGGGAWLGGYGSCVGGGGGGAAGGNGGGKIYLFASSKIIISGNVYSKGVFGGNGLQGTRKSNLNCKYDDGGNGGAGGNATVVQQSLGGEGILGNCGTGTTSGACGDACGTSCNSYKSGNGGNGGAGGGGGILISSSSIDVSGSIDVFGTGSRSDIGGAIKMFCNGELKIQDYNNLKYGRLYQSPGCSYSVSGPYWEDQVGNRITQTNLSDLVTMVVPGIGIQNKEVNYSVLKESTILFGLIKMSRVHDNLNTSADWIAGKKNDGSLELGSYFFRAIIGAIYNESGILAVVPAEDTLPVIVWNSPFYNSSKIVNYLTPEFMLDFNQSSYDPDDKLNITWDFGDGENISFTDYSVKEDSEAKHVTHSYSKNKVGYVTIRLTVREMIRGQAVTQAHEFYILNDSINVIPVISSPTDITNFTGYSAYFNASATHVMNCTNVSCPPTKDCSPYSDYNLYCFYEHAPLQKTLNGYDLIFNWKITTPGQDDTFDKTGSVDSAYNEVVEFDEPFSSTNRHTANLTVIYRK